MYSVLCPLCHFVNPADAKSCKACSADFFLTSDHGELGPTVMASWGERQGWRKRTATTTPPGAEPPQAPAERPLMHASTTTLPQRRAADAQDAPPARLDLGLRAAPAPDVAPPPAPLVSSDGPQWPAVPATDAAAPADPRTAPGGPPPHGMADRRVVAKAMARQAARRARMASLASTDTPVPVDVLLLDEDERTRAPLHALLEQFGFHVHAAQTLAQAERLAEDGHYAVAFIDIALDGSDGGAGIALCQQLQHRGAGAGTPVLLMTHNAKPADRVRAALVRSDLFLSKPLSRGDVARALESCSVELPADARRH